MKKKSFINLFGLFSLLLLTLGSYAQTNKSPSKAPLYWSPYEYCYIVSNNGMDGYIPEDVWKANIDWLNDNLKLFGYNMVSIDGWGDDSNFNENGYRTKHSSYWKHDYAWWSGYLQKRGMELGIYNNPLWVNLRAASEGKLIKGTNIPIENIVNRNEPAKWFSWVQVEKEGAEEYVKGYIQYYADMGVKYMRVDFLSWFEDGIDRNGDFSVPFNRPKEYYQTALRWMKEACDANGMTLSLVMPHLYNHAESELTYAGGSMIRINDDICDAGWYRFSDMSRGNYHHIWPTYENAFDGFIHWSDIAGFGANKLIPDGDFTRINTFANDEERKSAISLQLIAGGPIAVADQYNSIGDHIWAYQNLELLDLNYKGFSGKPMSRDLSDSKSQIWEGQMPNGEWIVGLFNRENTVETRSIDFQRDLGIQQGHVRDLWQHKDLGLSTFISENIPPHSCRIYRITRHTYQAESPEFSLRGGNYDRIISLTLATPTEGAVIYYTTDGSDPSPSSILYQEPIRISASTQIKAIAVKSGIAHSFVVGEGYNVAPVQINNSMYVAGSFSNWSLSQHPMYYLGNNDWKSNEISLDKGNYEFKFANTQDWSSDDWGNASGIHGVAKLTTGGDANASFSITESGKYYFLFNESTLHYSIEKSNTSLKRISNNIITEAEIGIIATGEKSFKIENIENAVVSVYNRQGLKVYSQKNVSNNQMIDLDNLSAGFYIIKASEGEKEKSHKIIIK